MRRSFFFHSYRLSRICLSDPPYIISVRKKANQFCNTNPVCLVNFLLFITSITESQNIAPDKHTFRAEKAQIRTNIG